MRIVRVRPKVICAILTVTSHKEDLLEFVQRNSEHGLGLGHARTYWRPILCGASYHQVVHRLGKG